MKIAVIGLGPHARRVYVPALRRLRERFGVEVALVVELEAKEAEVRAFLATRELRPELLFVRPFQQHMPEDVKAALSRATRREPLDGVIIATEPLSHRAYAEWALEERLHILMDKPVTTRENAATELQQAVGIYGDYEALLSAHGRLQKEKQTLFSINVQRRFHPGFQRVMELLKEIAERANCPITSIQSSHADGQWRLPSEMVTLGYHGYNEGYGKVSHSGYHFFDLAWWLYQSVAHLTGKQADFAEVFSSFQGPSGYLRQLDARDHERLFGPEYRSSRTHDEESLKQRMRNYGELDAFSTIRLLEEGESVCHLSINLLHNSFSRRDRLQPGKNLYKGNGRVKHEHHSIQQGPFQNIQVHSYQSRAEHDESSGDEHAVGGNNHFDIHVFRNSGLTGDARPLEIIRMGELEERAGYDSERLATEQAKEAVVVEFLQFIRGELPRERVRSSIEEHRVPVRLMSSVYASHVLQREGNNPIVGFALR
ncbi:Gfo/Idh/MocA family protein [Archangium violaceum]|uniref:Gfo/Idh/MocA family protein n=1 Tax=Archangium violaceum TaxID=83451 RepID=UPI0036D9FF47